MPINVGNYDEITRSKKKQGFDLEYQAQNLKADIRNTK